MGTLFLALKINSIFQEVKKYTAKDLRLTINYIIYVWLLIQRLFPEKTFFYISVKRLTPPQWSFYIDNSDGDSSIVADNQDVKNH